MSAASECDVAATSSLRFRGWDPDENGVTLLGHAGGVDLGQFRLWYSQAGTPRVSVHCDWSEKAQTATLTLKQSLPDTPGQTGRKPMHIPVDTALFGATSGARLAGPCVIELREAVQRHVFTGITERPITSLLRGFSAPVVLERDMSRDDLARLAMGDDDPFARYEAMQGLAVDLLREQIREAGTGAPIKVDALFIDTLAATLRDARLDPALIAEAVVLPTESYLGDQMPVVDVDAIHAVRQAFRVQIGTDLRPQWQSVYEANRDTAYAFTPVAKGRRRLKNIALQYLMAVQDEAAVALCAAHYESADNMTDCMAALSALANSETEYRERALRDFHARWKKDALVLDKWFSVQAMAQRPAVLADVERLTVHPDFGHANPNRLRALVSICRPIAIRTIAKTSWSVRPPMKAAAIAPAIAPGNAAGAIQRAARTSTVPMRKCAQLPEIEAATTTHSEMPCASCCPITRD